MKTLINFTSTLLLTLLIFSGCEYTDRSSEQNLTTLPTVFDEEFSSDAETLLNEQTPHITSVKLNNITELLEANSLTNVDVNPNFFVYFNQPMDIGSIFQGSVKLLDSNNNEIDIIIDPLDDNSNAVRITLANGVPLLNAAQYTLALSDTIQDINFNAITPLEIKFTTQFIGNNTSSTAIISTTPEDLALNVRIDAPIIIQLNQNIDPQNVNSHSIEVKKHNTEEYVTCDPTVENNIITFTHANAFSHETQYDVTTYIPSTGNKVFSFTTQNKDTLAPTFTSPTNFTLNDPLADIKIVATDTSDVTYSLQNDPTTDSASFVIDPNTGFISFNTPPDYTTPRTYTLSVVATDSSSNSSSQIITINIPDITGTSVLNISPDNKQLKVFLDTNITITFDKTLDASSIDNSSVQLTDSNDNVVLGTALVQGMSIIFDPFSNLNPNMHYTIKLDAGIKDTAGNTEANSSNFVSLFDTGTAFDVAELGHVYLSDVNSNFTTSNDFANDMVMDSSGNIYMTGAITNSDGDLDMIVAKYKPDGSLDTNFNGTGFFVDHNLAGGQVGSAHDEGKSIALDSVGNIYVTGYSTTSNGDTDMALWIIEQTATLKVAHLENNIAGSSNYDDEAMDISIDENNNIYVTGTSQDNTGDNDLFIQKFTLISGGTDVNKEFQDVKSSIAGGGGNDGGQSIVTKNGKIYVLAQSLNNYTPATFDLALLKYNNDGTLDTSFGTNGTGIVIQDIGNGDSRDDLPRDLLIDDLNRLYVISDSKIQGATNTDMALLKFTQNGNLDDTFNGTGYILPFNGLNAHVSAAALDNSNHIYVTGYTESTSNSMFITKFDTNSGANISEFGNGGFVINANSRGNSILLDANNSVYVTGSSTTNTQADLTLWRYNKIDNIAPEILSTTPSNGSTVTTNITQINITFSETMDTSKLLAFTNPVHDNISLKKGTASLYFSSNYSNNILTLTPNNPLTDNGDYTITFTEAVSDTSGNPLDISQRSFGFTKQ